MKKLNEEEIFINSACKGPLLVIILTNGLVIQLYQLVQIKTWTMSGSKLVFYNEIVCFTIFISEYLLAQ